MIVLEDSKAHGKTWAVFGASNHLNSCMIECNGNSWKAHSSSWKLFSTSSIIQSTSLNTRRDSRIRFSTQFWSWNSSWIILSLRRCWEHAEGNKIELLTVDGKLKVMSQEKNRILCSILILKQLLDYLASLESTVQPLRRFWEHHAWGNKMEFFTVDGKLISCLLSYQGQHQTHVATIELDSPLNSDHETALGLSGKLRINCTATV